MRKKDGEVAAYPVSSLQLRFVCEVAWYEFAVNPEEHSEGMLHEMEELRGLDITEQMRVRVCWRKLGQRTPSRRVFIIFVGQ